MGWLSRKSHGLPMGSHEHVDVPAFVGRNRAGEVDPAEHYETFARNGYGRNELVFACINERATSFPEGELRVYQPGPDGEELDDHPLRTLLTNPNPVLTEFELFELTLMHMDIGGVAYWQIVRGRSGQPAEIWPTRPDRMKILATNGPRVSQYGYEAEPGKVYAIPASDIIEFRFPNPLDGLVGHAPTRTAARSVSMDNAATDFADTMLRNSAVPGVVIETQQAIDREQAERIKATWKRAYSGSSRGEPAVLQQGMSARPLGMTLRDLEFGDLRTISESRICMAYGVPPILIGAKVGLDRSTFANYQEARVSLWEETLMPLQRRFRDRIAKDLLPQMRGLRGRAAALRWDNSSVLALQESEQARWERTTQALRAGALSVNDFRRLNGLRPAKDADEVFLRPAGVIPTTADGKPLYEPPEAPATPPTGGSNGP